MDYSPVTSTECSYIKSGQTKWTSYWGHWKENSGRQVSEEDHSLKNHQTGDKLPIFPPGYPSLDLRQPKTWKWAQGYRQRDHRRTPLIMSWGAGKEFPSAQKEWGNTLLFFFLSSILFLPQLPGNIVETEVVASTQCHWRDHCLKPEGEGASSLITGETLAFFSLISNASLWMQVQ